MYELVRYTIPVPVRGRGRAPPGGAGLCRRVGGAPGGSTPDDRELDVVCVLPCANVEGVRSVDCGLENVRDRWYTVAPPIATDTLLADAWSCEKERAGLIPAACACGRRSGRGTLPEDDEGTEVEEEFWE